MGISVLLSLSGLTVIPMASATHSSQVPRRSLHPTAEDNIPPRPVLRAVRHDLGDVGRNRGTAETEEGLPDPEEAFVKEAFRSFLYNFTVDASEGRAGGDMEDLDDVDPEDIRRRQAASSSAVDAAAGLYLREIRALGENTADDNQMDSRMLNVDLSHLAAFSQRLLRLSILYPADTVVYFDEVVAEVVQQEFADAAAVAQLPQIRTALCNHPIKCPMRDLDPIHLETLVALTGVVIRVSQVIPDMHTAAFRCQASRSRNQATYRCGHTEFVPLINGEVQEPTRCRRCGGKYTLQLLHSMCLFGSKQLLKMQESPESIPEGEAPQSVLVYAYDCLVDRVKPGDRVEVTGIYRASGVRANPRQRNLKVVYRTFVDGNHITKTSSGQNTTVHIPDDGREDEFEFFEAGTAFPSAPATTRFPEALMAKLEAIGHDPDVYDNLVASLAPNIWESDDVKRGLLCQLFGGTTKKIGDWQSRGEIHVLLCGDPSTAKSQLMSYVHKLTPRGVYVCGRGTSAVGLTASVSKDPETREFVLESGAVVLSDRGICCIDEFDKLDDGTRTILHEVMEQQTVSIAKAGLVCSLNARTAVLASANPISSRYDSRRSVVENINLPPTLLSRFDLIYLMLDSGSEDYDRRLATHLTSLYATNAQQNSAVPRIDREALSQYITYAKTFCHPRLSEEATQELVETYTALRKQGVDSSGKSITATPRQLEALIRIAEAQARMRLQREVSASHVKEAARLIQVSTYATIIDPTTGRIDFDQLNTGVGGTARARREAIQSAIMEILTGEAGGLDKEALATRTEEILNIQGKQQSRREFESVLQEMESVGAVGRTHIGRYITQ